MTEEKKQSLHEISPLLCEAYKSLIESGQVSFSLYDEQIRNIDSVVKTVNAQYFGIVRFPTPEQKAAAYFCLLIKDHPVVDGNKRLATLWLEIYVQSMGLMLANTMPLDELAVSVEHEKGLSLYELVAVVQKVLFNS